MTYVVLKRNFIIHAKTINLSLLCRYICCCRRSSNSQSINDFIFHISKNTYIFNLKELINCKKKSISHTKQARKGVCICQ